MRPLSFLVMAAATGACAFVAQNSDAAGIDLGTAFTYQGELIDGGVPVDGTCDFEITLWDDPAAGTQIGSTIAIAVAITDGRFSEPLDFGAGAMNGEARWLQFDVCCASPCSPAFTALSPRLELTPGPYAVRASEGVGPPNALEVDQTNGNVGIGTNAPATELHVSGLSPVSASTGQLRLDASETTGAADTGAGIVFVGHDGNIPRTGGAIQVLKEDSTVGNTRSFMRFSTRAASGLPVEQMRIDSDGNVGIGTASPSEMLDVSGNIQASGNIECGTMLTLNSVNSRIESGGALDLRTNGGRALRLVPSTTGTFLSPNLIGGHRDNSVLSDVVGGVISGGGAGGLINRVSDYYGSIGGGFNNLAGDDDADATNNQSATVSGGTGNQATAGFSTIGGGRFNEASGFDAVVPGGRSNTAAGDRSFAAGWNAKANHNGTFVWNDSLLGTDFASTADNQFLISADGGVGIGTTAPGAKLHVFEKGDGNGIPMVVGRQEATGSDILNVSFNIDPTARVFKLDVGGTGGNHLARIHLGDSTAATNDVTMFGNLGIGTTSPAATLHVAENGSNVRFRVDGDTATTPMLVGRTGDGVLTIFTRNGGLAGVITVAGSTVTYGAFTGSHFAWTDDDVESGVLVTLTGKNRRTDANADSEIQYGITPSSIANDARCGGVYLGVSNPAKPPTQTNPRLMAAVGNGNMWVVNTGRNFKPGDYLISSDVRGHAMLDDERRFAVGYVVARVAEPVDWSDVSDTVDGRKHKKISVFFESFVRGTQRVADMARELEEMRSQMASMAKAQGSQKTRLAAIEAQLAGMTATDNDLHASAK